MQVETFIIHMVEAKGVSTALLSGGAVLVAFGMDAQQALQLGAIAALGSSAGDALLTGLGLESKIESYLSNSYIDPMDVVGGAVGSAALLYLSGMSPSDSMKFGGVAGVAAGLAPKLAAMLTSKGQGSKGKSS